MKYTILSLMIAVLSICSCSTKQLPANSTATIAGTHDIPEDSTLYNPGVLIISYDANDSTAFEKLSDEVDRQKAEIIYKYNMINAVAIRLPQPHTLTATNKAIETFKALPGVLGVERDRIYTIDGK